MTVRHRGLAVDWLGYACARIEGAEAIVYTDPGRYGTLTGDWESNYGGVPHPSGPAYEARDGDVVVVTHDHHYDEDGIRRVAADDATLVVYENVSAARVNQNRGLTYAEPEALPYEVIRVAYGDTLAIDGVEIDVVPAYNRLEEPPSVGSPTVLHPRGFGCGFVLTIDGVRCFWTGDSDVVDEHSDLDVSLFLPSIAENITMGPTEAAGLAAQLDPALVLPIHYNSFPGLRADSRAFAASVAAEGIPVVLDEGGDRLSA